MKNILFSTTRQWNCGDEFILFGCINLFKEIIGESFNPVIYNRHPDLLYELADNDNVYASKNLCFRDNSLKGYMDANFIDLVVFAGSPEWSNDHCRTLYDIINRYDLPTIAIGIGSDNKSDNVTIKDTIRKFKLLIVRDPKLVNDITECCATYLPCPAIASAVMGQEKIITSVKKVALIYSGDKKRSVTPNNVPTETYNYLLDLYKRLLLEYSNKFDFSIICHYIDELLYALADFPNIDCLYSFDAKDYFELYRKHDFVIGCRVHGMGICASMGIPGIGISYDFRGGTMNGFLSDMITSQTDYQAVFELFDKSIVAISNKNNELLAHKKKTVYSYIGMIKDAVGETIVDSSKSIRNPVVPFLQNNISHHLENMIYETNNKLFNLQKKQKKYDRIAVSRSWKLIKPFLHIKKVYKKFEKNIKSILMAKTKWGREGFLEIINKKGNILDVGCGNNSPAFFRYNCPDIKYTGIDIGDYNQTCQDLADNYIIVPPEMFAEKILEFDNNFDAVFSSHNLEHCNNRDKTLIGMTKSLKIGGYLYCAFPTEKSIYFPSRKGTLNYYDDETHKDNPPAFAETVNILRQNGMKIIYKNKSYKPFFRYLYGMFSENKSRRSNKTTMYTWAFYGFEAVIWAKKVNENGK